MIISDLAQTSHKLHNAVLVNTKSIHCMGAWVYHELRGYNNRLAVYAVSCSCLYIHLVSLLLLLFGALNIRKPVRLCINHSHVKNSIT